MGDLGSVLVLNGVRSGSLSARVDRMYRTCDHCGRPVEPDTMVLALVVRSAGDDTAPGRSAGRLVTTCGHHHLDRIMAGATDLLG